MATASAGTKEFILDAYSELRFEVEAKNSEVALMLVSGLAEIFGTELAQKKWYKFSTGASVAIFTYHGCSIKAVGLKDFSYISKETPMPEYIDCHQALEQLRAKAKANDIRGPVAMVVGPTDVGKSTLTRILLNYAVRVGGKPLFVDLDVSRGSISLPGTISATVIEQPANIEGSFSQKAPLVYHFGHVSLAPQNEHYQTIVSNMAESVFKKMNEKKITKHSGMIIDTFGWVREKGHGHLLHIAQVFEVKLIYVLENERLYNELFSEKGSSLSVVLLPKSNGVLKKEELQRAEARELRIKEYFYGCRIRRHPYSIEVKFQQLKIYKIVVLNLPDSCLPIDMDAADMKTQVTAVKPNPSLLHHLLSVSFAKSTGKDIVCTNIAGFVCVTKVDMEQQKVTFLSPQPAPLPNGPLILSELQFVDNY